MQETPPFAVPLGSGAQPSGTLAGYVSMTVLPQHVSTPEKIEKLAWALLTLQAQLQASIKQFKVSPCSMWLPCGHAPAGLAAPLLQPGE